MRGQWIVTRHARCLGQELLYPPANPPATDAAHGGHRNPNQANKTNRDLHDKSDDGGRSNRGIPKTTFDGVGDAQGKGDHHNPSKLGASAQDKEPNASTCPLTWPTHLSAMQEHVACLRRVFPELRPLFEVSVVGHTTHSRRYFVPSVAGGKRKRSASGSRLAQADSVCVASWSTIRSRREGPRPAASRRLSSCCTARR